MTIGLVKRSLIIFGTLIIGSEIAWQLYRLIKWMGTASNLSEADEEKKLRDARKPPDLWNTVLFFPDENATKELNPSRAQFLEYLKEARMSIRVCIHLASFQDFANIIIQKWKDGLCIQVITDFDTLTAHNNFSCKDFIRVGVPVRLRNTGYLMHNKFIIIDDEALLTGSLNFTKTAFLTNSENVVVTTDPGIVLSYRRQFGLLWSESTEAELPRGRGGYR